MGVWVCGCAGGCHGRLSWATVLFTVQYSGWVILAYSQVHSACYTQNTLSKQLVIDKLYLGIHP